MYTLHQQKYFIIFIQLRPSINFTFTLFILGVTQYSGKNVVHYLIDPEMEFKEFQPRFKSGKTLFKFSAGLNLETFNTILSGTNHI